MIQEFNPVVSIQNVNNWCVFAENCTKVTRLELLGSLFIGYRSYINSGFIRSNVEIGRYCSIGRGGSIGLGEHDTTQFSTSSSFVDILPVVPLKLAQTNPVRRVIIGNDVWIGDGVFIKSGVVIGDGAVIGANAVITKDVPPYAIVAGVPARIIKYRFENEIIQNLKKIQWWNYDFQEIRSWVVNHSGILTNMVNDISNLRTYHPKKYRKVVPQNN